MPATDVVDFSGAGRRANVVVLTSSGACLTSVFRQENEDSKFIIYGKFASFARFRLRPLLPPSQALDA